MKPKIHLVKSKYKISFREPFIWNTFLGAFEKNIESFPHFYSKLKAKLLDQFLMRQTFWVNAIWNTIYPGIGAVSQNKLDQLSFWYTSWHYHADFWFLFSMMNENDKKWLDEQVILALCKSLSHLLFVSVLQFICFRIYYCASIVY